MTLLSCSCCNSVPVLTGVAIISGAIGLIFYGVAVLTMYNEGLMTSYLGGKYLGLLADAQRYRMRNTLTALIALTAWAWLPAYVLLANVWRGLAEDFSRR